jgi:phospholipase C
MRTVVLKVVVLALAGMSTLVGRASPAAAPCSGVTPPVRYQHVVWIFMENHHRGDVLGSAQAPFESGLAAGCATADRYAHVGRPSLPNYIGATSGVTAGIHDDRAPNRHVLTADNVFRQVRRAGRTTRTYAESMPGPCALSSTTRYAVKHNPAAYYQGGDDRAACRRDVVPMGSTDAGALASDIASGSLPDFALLVPDICNDTHDCPVRTGDRWLEQWVTKLTASRTYAEGRTAVFVVWDEPTPMPFIAVSPSVRPGSTVHGPVGHYSLLRTTEELLGLPLLANARTAPSMRAALQL